jgi:hypothetical protein
MRQTNTERLNPHVVSIPASQREAVLSAMKGKDPFREENHVIETTE